MNCTCCVRAPTPETPAAHDIRPVIPSASALSDLRLSAQKLQPPTSEGPQLLAFSDDPSTCFINLCCQVFAKRFHPFIVNELHRLRSQCRQSVPLVRLLYYGSSGNNCCLFAKCFILNHGRLFYLIHSPKRKSTSPGKEDFTTVLWQHDMNIQNSNFVGMSIFLLHVQIRVRGGDVLLATTCNIMMR